MKLAILDKDGTLTESASGSTFPQHPQDQALLPGVEEAVARLVADGYTLVIASNQGGCEAINPETGKPYKSIEDTIAEMRYCLKLLPAIEIAFFCPDFAGQKLYATLHSIESEVTGYYKRCDSFRKPHAGMLQAAMKWSCINDAVMIGDQDCDRLAAQAAGISFINADEWRIGIVKLV